MMFGAAIWPYTKCCLIRTYSWIVRTARNWSEQKLSIASCPQTRSWRSYKKITPNNTNRAVTRLNTTFWRCSVASHQIDQITYSSLNNVSRVLNMVHASSHKKCRRYCRYKKKMRKCWLVIELWFKMQINSIRWIVLWKVWMIRLSNLWREWRLRSMGIGLSSWIIFRLGGLMGVWSISNLIIRDKM